jgi:diamine N-acetyltransferase
VSSAVTICAAHELDIREIQRLAEEIWRRYYPGIISEAQIDYMLGIGYSASALGKFFTVPDAGAAIARNDAGPVGFAAWCPLDAKRALKLDKLYVLPQHHGAGIGRKLIEHVASRARAGGYPAVTLNVNRGNAKAIAAYERCGFTIRERGDFPIGNGFVMEDYVMVREL